MGWLFNSNKADQTEYSYGNIPPTPGISTWALGALPTIFYGTPKVKKISDNDEVFTNLSNQLLALNTSTPRPGRVRRSLSTTSLPETPIKFDAVTGILKTPGTVGKSKNVAFAGLNSISSEDEKSNSSHQISTPIPSGRIKSGLPSNFPGKFPSPFTPKVINSDLDEHTPLTQLTNKNTKENINNTRIIESSPGTSTFVPETPSTVKPNVLPLTPYNETLSTTPLSAIDINKIINQANKVYKSNKEINETTDKIFSLVDNVGKLEGNEVEELKRKVQTAMDYAKEKDDETSHYRLKLSQVMEESMEMMKKYEKLMKNGGDDNGDSNRINELTNDNKELTNKLQYKDSKISYLESELSEFKRNYNQIIDENEQLLKKTIESSSDFELRRMKRQLTDNEKENEKLRGEITELKNELKSSTSSTSSSKPSSAFQLQLLERQLTAKEKEIIELKASSQQTSDFELQQLKRQLKDKEIQNQKLESQITKLETNNRSNSFEIEHLKTKLQSSESTIKSLKLSNDRLTRQYESRSTTNVTTSPSTLLLSELTHFKNENESLTKQLELINNKYHLIQAKNETLQTQINTLHHQLLSKDTEKDDLDAHINLLTDQLRTKKLELDQVKAQLRPSEDQLKEIQRLKSTTRQLTIQLDSTNSNYNNIQQQHFTLQKENLNLIKENKLLTNKINQLENGISSIKTTSTKPNNLSLSRFGSDSPLPPLNPKSPNHHTLHNNVPRFNNITIPPIITKQNEPSYDYSMKDATGINEITMKDISSSIIGDPNRELASKLRLEKRRQQIRSANNSRMSID